jgi:hypothetical protein
MSPSTEYQLPTPQEVQTPFFSNNDATDSPPSQPSPLGYANHSTSYTPIDAMTPISTNPSRKRSRDETTFGTDFDGSYFSSQQVNTPAPIPEEKPVYGEGMVLLNPRTGMSISAESQTGTWYEETAEVETKAQQEEEGNSRPKLPTRKSIRLDSTASLPRLDDIAAAVAPISPPKSGIIEPEVDEATLALGIGWTKIASEDPDIQAAARGWAKYLHNHYSTHIHGAEILLRSKGLNAYLVGGQEGYFLFSDDLSEGRMLARTWETCLQNLRTQPTVFDGADVLRPENSPSPETNGGMDSHTAAATNGYSTLLGTAQHVQGLVNGHEAMDVD